MQDDSSGEDRKANAQVDAVDHGNRATRIPLFSDGAVEKVETIKHAHGFSTEFELLTRLRAIHYDIGSLYGYDQTSKKEKRAFARRVFDHATALAELIRDAHDGTSNEAISAPPKFSSRHARCWTQ